MRREGIALVLSAPSGAGKTTLIKRLLAEFPHFGYSVSCTTRRPRQGEVHGKDYFFLSREEFERRRAEQSFAEWAEVHGNFYGTPLAPVKEMLRQGQDVLFDIDVQGAAQLKLTLEEAAFAFILPPSMAELERRLRGRGLDDEETIQRRLNNARREMLETRWYDALVVNDDLDAAYDALRAVYLAATLAPGRNPRLVEELLAR
ncbi:MAG: guanylate kinase [Desulfovibrio sp.]|uniref:guanylate kinase n=1 Tax=Desulfovibrio TaxID=872 RepID=UPI002583751C|nr:MULTISPECIES: guanylate kinase [Desulfovibrio]MCD7982975.1 guanylate kinase [Desulfovibrio sp.]MDY3808983.1 guanylate kinase [Desulfovibrio porci]